MKKRILLAEDHSIVISGIKIIFDLEFQGYILDVVRDGSALMSALKMNNYDLTILDLHLQDGDSFHLIKDIISIYPALSILIFTAESENIYAQRLYKEGVKGFLNKQANETEIITAIRSVLNGGFYISESYKHSLILNDTILKTQNPFTGLSQRELEIIKLMLAGKRTQEICHELNLQPSTVSTFKSKIFTKLNISNIIELNELSKKYF